MNDRLFKLGTTSFIVPDHIIPNVKKLGPYFDEIELLVFESQPKEVLPTAAQVSELYDLSKEHNLTYNVHLPVDVSLSSEDKDEQEQAKDVLLDVISLFKSLPVTTHTLHLEIPTAVKSDMDDAGRIQLWKDEFHKGFDDFLFQLNDPNCLSIETLNYPFALIEDLVQEYHLPICLDMGHTIKYGYGWQQIVNTYQSRIPLLHLHGVDFSGDYLKDHQGLDCLPKAQLDPVLTFLQSYIGTVSLEVFNFKNLAGSLKCLSLHFNRIPQIESL